MNQPRRNRYRLVLEHLEDRALLNAPSLFDMNQFRLDPTGAYDASRILVKFRPEVANPESSAILAGTTLEAPLHIAPNLREVLLADGVTVEQALAAYRASPAVLYAEPNSLGYVQQIPNDPMWGQLYGMQRISAPQAWDYWQGHQYMTAAVFDTGVSYDHPDLCRNIWINQYEIPPARLANLIDIDGDYHITFWDLNDPRNQGLGKITDQNGDGRICGSDILRPMTGDTGGWADGVDNEGNGFPDDLIGWNMAENNNNPLDPFGHGTHLAGTIGAVGNNNLGVVGVNWRLQIMPVKISVGATGTISLNAAILATYYAAWWQVPVSNNSWGGTAVNQALKDAIAWARTQGHLFVATAGGSNTNNNTNPVYPANYGTPGGHGAVLDNVLSVMATDSNDLKASFSNYGTNTVHLAAPGVSIASTYLNNGYSNLSGTSMATAHVTGAVAYLKSIYPGKSYLQIKAAILNGVDPLGLQSITGGRLNLFRSLIIAGPGGAPGQSENPNLENPDGTGAPSVVGGSMGLIVDSLLGLSTDLVQAPLAAHTPSVSETPVENVPDALFQKMIETPVLLDHTPILTDRVDGLFDRNLVTSL